MMYFMGGQQGRGGKNVSLISETSGGLGEMFEGHFSHVVMGGQVTVSSICRHWWEQEINKIIYSLSLLY